jgi:glycosyltransferase involved in cell wall biosynthesis/SAM-dependent methyltransferase
MLPLSVIINTFNRAELLKITLKSLVDQSLDQKHYEVIIIDDGSRDNTKEIVNGFYGQLPIKYFYQNNAGRASAKNHGIYAAQGKIVLFLDDDDIATATLLEEHVKFHRKYPKDNYAVLSYTGWSPNLTITPLMHFVTEVACFMFSYPYLKHKDVLDYTYFWTGRLSCKRSFLIEHAVFNPTMDVYEDIELGYRLSPYGLKIIYNSKAVSEMIRPLTFDDFCERCIKQGRIAYIFSRLHSVPEIHNYTEVTGAKEKWHEIRHIYHAKIRSARELDKIANMKLKYGFDLDDLTKKLLHEAYWWAFKACKIKGIMDAKEDGGGRETDMTSHDTSPEERSIAIGQSNNADTSFYVRTNQSVEIDWTVFYNYKQLVEEEVDEYCSIEVTEDLTEGGIHASNAWSYWFKYLSERIWKTSLGAEISNFCNLLHNPRILSLGCGYGGHELAVARSLKKPYEIIATDLNGRLFAKAIKEARAHDYNLTFKAIDLNFIEIEADSFDVIYAHAALHHLLNLENIFYEIYKGLRKHGRLIIQDIIGKTQILFWKDNVDFARNLVKQMPAKYKGGVCDLGEIVPPYIEPSTQVGMEGIRQEEIELQVPKYFTPVKMFKYGSFIRIICTNPIIAKLLDPDREEAREYLESLYNLDLKQIQDGKLRPTEMFSVYQKKETVDIDTINSEAHCDLGEQYLAHGNKYKASACIQKAVSLDEKNLKARNLLSKLHSVTTLPYRHFNSDGSRELT